jgi:membrane protease YdiL (CAAX protease family)
MARAIAIGIVAGLTIELFAISITTPWIASVTGTLPDISDVRDLVGNWRLLIILLVVSWILAAFGEELAFRGYLMNRVADGLGRTRVAWIISPRRSERLLRHRSWHSGPCWHRAGITLRFLARRVLLASGRNLTLPIAAHGVSNTLALVLIYLDRYQGVS